MVSLARALCKVGVYCLRFDHMGHGDSDGNFEDATVNTRLSDIKCAVEYLVKNTEIEKVGLLGLRFGATLAALMNEEMEEIKCLCLISPILKGSNYIDECLRSNLATQMATTRKICRNRKQLVDDLMAGELINIDGYLLSKDLYLQMTSIDLLKLEYRNARYGKSVLIVNAQDKSQKQYEIHLDELCKRYRDGHYHQAIVQTVTEHPLWKDGVRYIPEAENINNEIRMWLQKINKIEDDQ